MVSAIGSSTFSSPAGSGPSVTSLQAQLERCQQQLSDNVNCDSANTREGRQTIQALSNKIGEIKARIQEAELAKTDKPPAPESGRQDAPGAKPETAAAGTQHATGATPAFGLALTGLGTRLDVFA